MPSPTASRLPRKRDVVDLPQAGIKGHSHMLMMDKNNAEVAA